jgi:hypothetical protein
MINYVVFGTATGSPVKWGQCQPELLDAQAGQGERALATTSLTVDGNRAIFWEMVKVKREERYSAGVMTPFGLLDTNPESRASIVGLYADAVWAVVSSDATYSRDFTKADQQQVTLNAVQMAAVGRLVVDYIDAVHQRSQALRALIYAPETDMAGLLAIDVSAGWPGQVDEPEPQPVFTPMPPQEPEE